MSKHLRRKTQPMIEREKEKDTKPAGNKGRPGEGIQSTDGKQPKDYSSMIADLIPAWTADMPSTSEQRKKSSADTTILK